MTVESINHKLPNTTNDISGYQVFMSYIKSENIQINSSNSIKHYQCIDNSNYPITQEDLNYALEFLATSGKDSQCAMDGEILYGCIDDIHYHDLLNDLDEEFTLVTYSFSPDSTVYKGIDSKVYYNKLQPHALKKGDVITINTFFSTSVSKEKARTYGKTLLIITGLDKIKCIIPSIASIPNAGSQTFEQEVLLNRNFEITVTNIVGNDIHLTINRAI